MYVMCSKSCINCIFFFNSSTKLCSWLSQICNVCVLLQVIFGLVQSLVYLFKTRFLADTFVLFLNVSKEDLIYNFQWNIQSTILITHCRYFLCAKYFVNINDVAFSYSRIQFLMEKKDDQLHCPVSIITLQRQNISQYYQMPCQELYPFNDLQ